MPILAVESEEWLPGGAANVARNITALGGRAELIGIVGDDEPARRLKEQLAADDRLRARLVVDKSRPTILKTRCVAQGQQMLRLDREVVRPIDDTTISKVVAQVTASLPRIDTIVLSDYGKGMLHPRLIAAIITAAREAGKPVLVDPKGRDYTRYRGATVLTPNQKEAQEATGIAIEDNASLSAAAHKLQRIVQGDGIVITRGPAGIAVFPRRGKPTLVPAQAREVYDVTGAGDTVIAVMALSLGSSATLAQAAALANIAGGIVVGIEGVATISADTLGRAVEAGNTGDFRKLVTREELVQAIRSERQHGRRIVFTNGFFDLLHSGHIRLLQEARGAGDCLVVAVNSDAGTRRLKGPPRPILSERERTDLLAALPAVNYLVLFDEDTPEALLDLIRPDVLVKGGDENTRIDDIVGHERVRAHGGEIRILRLDKDMPRISAILERATGTQPARTPARRKNRSNRP